MSELKPTLLLILDGWGIAPAGKGNAVSLARTPNLDRLVSENPSTQLQCTGPAVGLPKGFMGNSEVGHTNIGAGRVVYQDMTRIDMALENDELKTNSVISELLDKTKKRGGRVHFMGLVSDGGVHSHIHHLYGLLQAAKDKEVEAVVHVFLDGRDTPPTSGAGYVQDLQDTMKEMGVGVIATISGRYYAMDRDKRWDRNALAYAAVICSEGIEVSDPVQAVKDAYAQGENDEFVKPRVVKQEDGGIISVDDGDSIFFFNFRADRARQLVRSFFDPDFSEFERKKVPDLADLATMTRYDEQFDLPVAFAPQSLEQTVGECISGMDKRQLRIAETEKYAHVTYFMNCGREEPFPGEERVMIPSPQEVATYDEKPEMSARKVTDAFIEEWSKGIYTFAACNLANLDMVGHTGIIEAAVKACETVDECVGRIVDTVSASGGRVLLTADHGNAEEMLDTNGETQTAHSKNPVPFVLIDADMPDAKLREGVLGDIGPTIWTLWGLAVPEKMSGKSIVQKA